MTTIPYYDAKTILKTLPLDRAMDVIEAGLRSHVDPEQDGPRLFSDAPDGEFLLMPAYGRDYSGVKALTIAPNNPARGLEKIQGVYILYSSDSLAPIALMEGSSLTAIRTPAVTLSAVRQLAALAPDGAAPPAAPRVLILGAGVQALGHINAAKFVFPDAEFDIVGRQPDKVTALIGTAKETDEATVLRDRTAEREDAVAEADVILCVTSSSEALFDGRLVRPNTIVAAVGTHGLDKREVDDHLILSSDVVVEGRGSAQRENGNLATAVTADDWPTTHFANLRDLALGNVSRSAGKPALYTGVGMSWEDLVCASFIHETLS